MRHRGVRPRSGVSLGEPAPFTFAPVTTDEPMGEQAPIWVAEDEDIPRPIAAGTPNLDPSAILDERVHAFACDPHPKGLRRQFPQGVVEVGGCHGGS